MSDRIDLNTEALDILIPRTFAAAPHLAAALHAVRPGHIGFPKLLADRTRLLAKRRAIAVDHYSVSRRHVLVVETVRPAIAAWGFAYDARVGPDDVAASINEPSLPAAFDLVDDAEDIPAKPSGPVH